MSLSGLSGLSGITGITPVTSNLGGGVEWPLQKFLYRELDSQQICSFKAKTLLSPSIDGLIAEAGATGEGLAVYVVGGVLYFTGGAGANGYTVGVDAIHESWSIVGTAKRLIEFSAKTDNGFCQSMLAVDGRIVSSSTASAVSQICGGNGGGLRAQLGDSTQFGKLRFSYPYGSTIADYPEVVEECVVFPGQSIF